MDTIKNALGLAMNMWLANTVGGYAGMTSWEKRHWKECEEALGCEFHIWHGAFYGASEETIARRGHERAEA